MRQVNIYVEGTGDRIFLANYLAVVLGFELELEVSKNEKSRQYYFRNEKTEGEIRLLNGWKTLFHPDFKTDLEMDDEDGILSLVLVDADFPADGGFQKRYETLEKLSYRTLFERFILPNNQDDGYIETLLKAIVAPICESILGCILEQEKCIRGANLPAAISLKLYKEKDIIKKQIAQFRTRLNNESKALESGKGFQNHAIWNLHHAYLDPLKNFLTQHLLPANTPPT